MFEMSDNYGTSYNHDISINYPSTDTDYHAYQGQSIEIQLGQTVYGGTLDVTQGVLTVDYKKIAIPKTGWQFFEVASGKGVFLNTANIPSDAVHTAIPFCNAFLGVSSAGNNIEAYEKGNNTFCFRSPTYDRIYIRADQFGTDTSALETFLSDCEMCYKYTNPQTIQLTTQQLTTLLGQNNVWSDADSINLEYATNNYVWDTLHKIDTNIQNLEANDIAYDNTDSTLTATNVQDAITELSTTSSGVVSLTQAQYNELTPAQQNNGTVYMITDGTDGWLASDSIYINTTSGLTATNVQDAIDELASSTLPPVTASDNGKFLQVVNGEWAAVTIPSANGGAF